MTSDAQLAVDPARLASAASTLDSVAGSLTDGAPALRITPDAGASSDEVGTSLALLAQAVVGVATEVRDIADAVRTSAADFTATDQAVSGSMQQRGQALLP